MPNERRETQDFMTAYNGLKNAARKLQEMSRESEPDLDRTLGELQDAKKCYDRCSEVIDRIKAQVDAIFSDSKISPEPAKKLIEPTRGAEASGTDFGRRRTDHDDAPRGGPAHADVNSLRTGKLTGNFQKSGPQRCLSSRIRQAQQGG